MAELSVVLISKDQEWNMTRLVESVLRETHHIPETEVVLVDSASTDRTTEIAAQFPIKVLKLHPHQRLSASAGRYVGYNHTKGDLILFLDGDMELCEGWLDPALATMHTKPDVAVVCGLVMDRPIPAQGQTDGPVLPGLDADVVAVAVPHGGGAAMYRRCVLDQVGAFNPYLFSDEEPELCLRIRHAGFRVVRISRPIVFHYSAPAEALSTFLAKRSSKIWIGYGQNMRYFFGTPLFWQYLRERGWSIAPGLAILLGLAALVTSVWTGRLIWIALWLAGAVMLTVVIAIRKRSLKRAFLTLLRRLLILDGTLRGLLLKPYDPMSYPGKYDTVR